MSRRRKQSLHHNLEFQDPFEGGKNVVFHNEHRSRKGRRWKETSLAYKRYKAKKKGYELNRG